MDKIVETMSAMNYIDDIPIAPGGRTIRFREGGANPLFIQSTSEKGETE